MQSHGFKTILLDHNYSKQSDPLYTTLNCKTKMDQNSSSNASGLKTTNTPNRSKNKTRRKRKQLNRKNRKSLKRLKNSCRDSFNSKPVSAMLIDINNLVRDSILQERAEDDDVPSTSKNAQNQNETVSHTPKNTQNLNLNKDKSAKNTHTGISKRILRSVHRRYFHSTPKFKNNRKLNFTGNLSIIKNIPPTLPIIAEKVNDEENSMKITNDSVEEGEIRTQVEKTTMDDDDCVLIEPTIEAITIDDDDDGHLTVQPSINAQISSAPSVNSPGYMSFSKYVTYGSAQQIVPLTTTSTLRKISPSTPNQIPSNFVDLTETPKIPPLLNYYYDVTRHNGRNVKNMRRKNQNAKSHKKNETKNTEHTIEQSTSNGVSKDNEVILLDTFECDKPGVDNKSDADCSVIFVSETKKSEALDFIPLCSKDVPNPIKMPANLHWKEKRMHRKNNVELFTQSEKKKINAYNNNAYNPDKEKQLKSKKRMVIIDGSNVAFFHGLQKDFSVKGLKICIDYFVKMGHEVKAVVPSFRLQKFKSTDPDTLEKLRSENFIVMTPGKNLGGQKCQSYDDRFILQLACEMDAAVVSNDNFRDLVQENIGFKKIIENRVVTYTWCNDIFMVPKDPYGRNGPSLDSILNRF